MKDYHLHSGLLDHTEDNLERIVDAAVSLGFTEVAITEHFVWPLIKKPRGTDEDDYDTLFSQRELIPNDTRKTTDLSDYFDQIERQQQRFNIKILKGLEVDYFPEFEEEIKQCLSRHKIDVILGSCHYILHPSLPTDNEYIHVGHSKLISLYVNEYGREKLYSTYFDNILLAIKSKMFDFIAHLDFLKKGFTGYNCYQADCYLNTILAELIKNDVGLEVNVSGIKDVGETYPSREIIKKYCDMGGKKLSIGSDAHSISRMKKMSPIIKDLSKIYQIC